MMRITREQRMDLLKRGARVRVGAAWNPEHRMAEGLVVAVSDTPMICVLQDDGTKNWWGVDLPMTEVEKTDVQVGAEGAPLAVQPGLSQVLDLVDLWRREPGAFPDGAAAVLEQIVEAVAAR